MNYQVDARGKNCPMPVLMAKTEADSKKEAFSVIVDNQIAVENLKRFAGSSGYAVTVDAAGSDFEVHFKKSQASLEETHLTDDKSWAIFVSKDQIGEGDFELGVSLLKMFFYTLTQDSNLPDCILFMNSGVKAAVENEQVVEHLKDLHEKGVEILICGTCLNFYEIANKVQVGTVSNMYDIVDTMKAVNKVVSI